ncbi:helix-turn-helix domain-containing protein [Billgrantia pellis]|uniref:Helix-turn-helix domain-containing protein n=1 Tax=Billgrantia pellis TaxID=2606936 RepID=A0A7V7KHN9_9GAMM|nr:helix-turn-helix domain-containing protein [Halomonas pellis]KAA0013701.1 helix-turn-helix domain-containing protein [Halomonas pellis]
MGIRSVSEHAPGTPVTGCFSCYLSATCLPQGLTPEESAQLEAIIPPSLKLEKGHALMVQNSAFKSLYAVRSGSLKQVTTTESEESLVTALYLPGDMVGFDAIGTDTCPGDVIALETTTVCEYPYERLDGLCNGIPTLRRRLQRNLSQAMHEERLRLHLLLSRKAEVRLACFLLVISERFRRRGYSSRHFRLAFSRGDIGNYLGLTYETVGRTLAAFQAQNLLTVRGREYRLLDLAQLARLADSTGRRQRRA